MPPSVCLDMWWVVGLIEHRFSSQLEQIMLAPNESFCVSSLAALRALMAKPEHNVQAVVIPTEDQRKSISPRRTLFYTCDTA